MRIRELFAAVVVVMIVCATSGAQKSASNNTGTSSTRADLPLVDLDGYKKILATYKGKPLVVTFWATWCEPCRYEFPTLVELAKEYQPKGLAIYGVNLDSNADLHVMRDFLAKNKPGFPSYRQKPGIDVDAFYVGVNPQWTGTMPETIFYSRDGRIAAHFEGQQTRADFERGIQAILAQ